MPVSPELGLELTRRILAIYLAAEATMLAAVERRIKRGIAEDGWAEKKLAEVQAMRAEARAEVRRLEGLVGGEVTTVLEEAFDLGIKGALKDLAKTGSEMAFGRADRSHLRGLIEETVTSLRSTHLRILRSTDDIYRQVIAETSAQTLVGTQTRRQAAQAALNRFADAGVTGFVDGRGRNWNLASYAEMATRSATGRAAVSGHVETLVVNGQDLGIISNAPEECEICRPWEGKVVSFTGQTPGYPTLDAARADGLFHAGCRHSVGAYFPGITRPMKNTADPVGDRERQHQRYLERNLRRWKRRAAVGDPAAAAKVGEWRSKLKTFVDENDRKRLPYREQIGAAV